MSPQDAAEWGQILATGGPAVLLAVGLVVTVWAYTTRRVVSGREHQQMVEFYERQLERRDAREERLWEAALKGQVLGEKLLSITEDLARERRSPK